MYVVRVAVHWVHRAGRRRLFPCSVRDPIRPTVRQTCERLASSLQVRVASPELLRAHVRPVPFGWAACKGFCPLRDITGARPLTARLPKPHYVPSAGVRSLSTVYAAPRLQGLFHPRAASRASSRSGGSLSAQRARFVSRRCPLVVGAIGARRISRSNVHSDRAPASRLRSAQRRVLAPPVISRRCGRSPLRVPCSSRYFIPRHRPWLPKIARS